MEAGSHIGPSRLSATGGAASPLAALNSSRLTGPHCHPISLMHYGTCDILPLPVTFERLNFAFPNNFTLPLPSIDTPAIASAATCALPLPRISTSADFAARVLPLKLPEPYIFN